ncbi:MAG: hypothetical protein LC713_03920 [Actinobacteria bacterium]|nr:hypothetical protein [Actinomycetota bacterium]
MTVRSLPCLLLACTALGAGCGDDRQPTATAPSTVPDKPPTARQLGQIRSTPSSPFFWLGPSYGGRRLTRATLTAADPPDSIFQYGSPTCAVRIGCSYDLGVATLRGRDPDTTQRCWGRLGPAFALGCGRSTVLQVYSGPVEVFVSLRPGGPARTIGALRLKRLGTAVGPPLDGLVAPKPFTCKEAKQFPPEFRATVPAQLQPGACLG